MRRHVLMAALALMLFVAVDPQAQATVAPDPKARAVVVVQSDPDVCARTTNSASSVNRGIAALIVHDLVGRSCVNGGPSCEEFWAYTGSQWGRLGWCSRDFAVYPTSLPGVVMICSGKAYSLVRTGPDFHFPAIARVSTDTTVGADRVQLAATARDWQDGVAWYRVNWHGHAAWVASFRVASVDEGCAKWAAYWAYRHHV